jgi:hypothetical protein
MMMIKKKPKVAVAKSRLRLAAFDALEVEEVDDEMCSGARRALDSELKANYI